VEQSFEFLGQLLLKLLVLVEQTEDFADEHPQEYLWHELEVVSGKDVEYDAYLLVDLLLLLAVVHDGFREDVRLDFGEQLLVQAEFDAVLHHQLRLKQHREDFDHLQLVFLAQQLEDGHHDVQAGVQETLHQQVQLFARFGAEVVIEPLGIERQVVLQFLLKRFKFFDQFGQFFLIF